jgi:threonine aldolase
MNTKSKTQQFASDNYSGACPEAMDYLIKVNSGHEPSYGEDRWTSEACDAFRDLFQKDCEVFFLSTGTAANSLTLASMCHSYHSIICHQLAHVETDECGAPEFFSHGSKILTAEGVDGKILPENIEKIVSLRTDIHYPKPKIVSVTQATEVGRVYTPDELMKIGEMARKHHLKYHMDGARFANAIAFLNIAPKAVTVDVGVDVLVFGGTKNGLAFGEVAVFFDLETAEEFAYRCKQAGQLTSKMRFIAAQWLGILKNGAWINYAKTANDRATLLAAELAKIDEIEIMYPQEANSVFIKIPESLTNSLREKGWKFYTFIGNGGARLMCSWDTKEETIHEFITDLKSMIRRH